MSQLPPQAPLKAIMGLNIIATLFSMGVMITLIALGYSGFGTNYNAANACNSYLTAKYETQIYVGYRLRFMMTNVAVLFLSINTIHSIQSFLQFQKMQQRKNAQIFQWNQKELCLKYLCQSVAILSLTSIFGFYISIIVEQGKCFRSIYVNWIIIMLLSMFSLLLTIISWILVFKYVLDMPSQVKIQKYGKSVQMGLIRQRQNQMQNIFETQGSELYKTIKRQNKDSAQPLIYHNAPMTLFHNQIARPLRKQSILERSHFDGQEINQNIYQTNYQVYQQLASPSNRRKNGVPISFNQRKKSSSSQKVAQDSAVKTRSSAMIQAKKNKFREINPLKESVHVKAQEQVDEQVIISQNKMKNLPRPYVQYIKQAKKPKRKPPNIDLILQNFNKQESLKAQALALQQQKSFLKKYRKDQQQKMQKRQNKEQIQLIDEQLKKIQQKQEAQHQQTTLPLNQAQLFFHKPRSDNPARKRRKALFNEDVSDSNQLIEQNQKQLIINRIKSAKIANKQIFKPEFLVKIVKQPKKRNITQTKEQIMLNFLKSKYSVPEQIQQDKEKE